MIHYQFPKLNIFPNEVTDSLKSSLVGEANYPLMEIKREWEESLIRSVGLDKDFWKELLKQDYFMPLFSEILENIYRNVKDEEEITHFLKNNFEEDIEKKIKEEIKKDFKILSSDNPEINKTSMIYTKDYIIFSFFSKTSNPNDEEVFNRLGLNKFYEEKIFNYLIELVQDGVLNDVNLFLLASLIKWDFNADFFTNYEKNLIGNPLELRFYYSWEESDIIFAENILSEMFRRIESFYFIFENRDIFNIFKYINISETLQDYFYDESFKRKVAKFLIDDDRDIYNLFESCEELKEILPEEYLKEFLDNNGFESIEEFCEEEGDYFQSIDERL